MSTDNEENSSSSPNSSSSDEGDAPAQGHAQQLHQTPNGSPTSSNQSRSPSESSSDNGESAQGLGGQSTPRLSPEAEDSDALRDPIRVSSSMDQEVARGADSPCVSPAHGHEVDDSSIHSDEHEARTENDTGAGSPAGEDEHLEGGNASSSDDDEQYGKGESSEQKVKGSSDSDEDFDAKVATTATSVSKSEEPSEKSDNDELSDSNEHPTKQRSAHFFLGGSEEPDSSRSPPSERQPEREVVSKKRLVLSSSDDENEGAYGSPAAHRDKKEATGGLDDIDLSDSSDGSSSREDKSGRGRGSDKDDDDSDQSANHNRKDFTEDDIVGPRLYPDPETAEEEDERPEPTIVEVNTARICPNIKEQGLYFVKFPNFLSIEPRPFDHEHYEDEFDEDDLLDEEGRARLKLRVENTIRWRYAFDDAGNIVKLSNSKVVRWSDGTMSLYLGNEVFDVQTQPMQHDNHLFMRQGAGLQGHAVFKEKLTFRPISTDSITHRKVTLSMADRSNKSQRVKVLNAVGMDPESQKAELVRREEERLRAQNRREAQMRRNRARPSTRMGLSSDFLEGREREDDSDADESISAIKSRYKNRYDDGPLIGHSDSEDSDAKRVHDDKSSSDSDTVREQKKQKKKKKIIEDDDEDEN
ncbi:unnamed protein product [Anisakis simplex]|uniref:RNA polymerase-associated protein LEO1 (inferred by orthology to a human protein) n=1 Tax=Anisakis simplex TaxID=6269 RepID=A0A0M3K174_ANISI|nr:unnamed protein product [Anisakis simplex]